MGRLRNFIEQRKQNNLQRKYAMMLHNKQPIFSSFGKDIYASDVVQSVVKCITDELLKCQPMHVKEIDKSIVPVYSDISKVLDSPNDLMTTADFISKITYIYMTQYNVFIYPQWQYYTDNAGKTQSRLVALYPLQPMTTQFYEDETGELGVEFTFSDGSRSGILPYTSLIHWRKDYSESAYMGGDVNGRANIRGLLKLLETNNTLIEALPNAVKASYAINGVIKYGSLLSEEKMRENLAQFNEQLEQNKSGIAATDMGGEFNSITRDIKLIDEPTLRFLDEKILRFFKVPLCILKGDFTTAQHEAFIQNTIEPLIVTIGQAFTKTLFSGRSSFGYGNKIVFYFDRIESMSTEQKIKIVQELAGRGTLTNNYILAMFGLPPYDGGDVRYMSLNYIDVNIANQYQLSKAKTTQGGENNVDQQE